MQLLIRQWRTKRGMKLRDLAKHTGISYPMLSAYEIGTNDPSLPRLVLIARALGVAVDDLFPLVGQPSLDTLDATPTPAEVLP